MPDLVITVTIPSAKVAAYRTKFLKAQPIPLVPDPEWVDPEDGSEAPMIAEFTAAQWFKEFLRRQVAKQLRRGEAAINRDDFVPSDVDDIS